MDDQRASPLALAARLPFHGSGDAGRDAPRDSLGRQGVARGCSFSRKAEVLPGLAGVARATDVTFGQPNATGRQPPTIELLYQRLRIACRRGPLGRSERL